jgi:hypothetical protein
MSLRLPIAVALVALTAAAQNREFAIGMQYYEDAEFGRAAAQFVLPCNADGSAEACYWAGISYERLADTRVPFGCRAAAKAHIFLTKAASLAPHRPAYRDALFDFLLDNADCSRTALREAQGILSGIAGSDADYELLNSRLKEAKHWNASPEARLSRVFLALPRATFRVSALPAAALKKTDARSGCGLKHADPSF